MSKRCFHCNQFVASRGRKVRRVHWLYGEDHEEPGYACPTHFAAYYRPKIIVGNFITRLRRHRALNSDSETLKLDFPTEDLLASGDRLFAELVDVIRTRNIDVLSVDWTLQYIFYLTGNSLLRSTTKRYIINNNNSTGGLCGSTTEDLNRGFFDDTSISCAS